MQRGLRHADHLDPVSDRWCSGSSGDLLRDEVQKGTPLGKEVAAIMSEGALVSPSIIMALLRRRMASFPGAYVLLDGFPRSKQNAEDFEKICGKAEMAISLVCPDEVMVQRILSRGLESGRADDNAEGGRPEARKPAGHPRSCLPLDASWSL